VLHLVEHACDGHRPREADPHRHEVDEIGGSCSCTCPRSRMVVTMREQRAAMTDSNARNRRASFSDVTFASCISKNKENFIALLVYRPRAWRCDHQEDPAPTCSANSATVRALNKTISGSRAASSVSMRVTTFSADIESPPISKKSS
jgi:hypothetical protein